MPESQALGRTTDSPGEHGRDQRLDVARLGAVDPRVLIGSIAALACLVLFGELPGRPLILHVLQKLAHPAVFGLIAVGLLVLEQQRQAAARSVPIQYLRALLIATAIGAMTEIAQLFTHRDPSLRDVALDARGAACALAFVAAFDVRCRLPPRPTLWRGAYLAVALALTGIILMPLAWASAGYTQRAWRYPTLFVAATRLDLLFVGLTGSAPELTRLPSSLARSPQELALRVPLQARPYAGVTLDEPSPDWRGHRVLAVEVSNAGRNELLLHVRVHDRSHDWTAGDRYNAEVRVPAGTRSTFEFPLEAIRTAPHGRSMDLAHVAGLALYRAGPEGPREFWLHRVELR